MRIPVTEKKRIALGDWSPLVASLADSASPQKLPSPNLASAIIPSSSSSSASPAPRYLAGAPPSRSAHCLSKCTTARSGMHPELSIVDVDDLNKKKSMKRLTCRKCEGHGVISILKGHAAACQFKDCQCGTCNSVMSMRANALIRRFRHRQPDQNLAVLKTIRSKNGNMRLRIVPKAGKADEVSGTTITYDDVRGHTYTTIVPPLTRDSYSNASSPASTLSAASPSLSVSPPLLSADSFQPQLLLTAVHADYIKILQQAALLSQLLCPSTSGLLGPSVSSFPLSLLLGQQSPLSSMSTLSSSSSPSSTTSSLFGATYN